MENIIYTDADLNAFLVANEEQSGNTIEVVIEADSTASQELTITAGDASVTVQITPSSKNVVDVPAMLWNFGDVTTITLSKGGTDAGTITINFPGAIDSDAALNETETDNEFTMQGSASVQEQIVSLQESVERVSAQTLAYILPSAVDQSSIADGGNSTTETFEFEAGAEDVKVSFFTCIQFLASTTVTAADAYEDLNLTITISLDGVAVATILQAYRDGRQVLMLNHLVENISKGNHTLTLNIATAGGSVSVMQIIAAYLLTAKSTGGGSVSTQALFTNGEWSPGVLADGLSAEKMTESAYINGVENSVIKKSIASTNHGAMPGKSTLSSWFLTSFVLLYGEYYAENFYMQTDGVYTKAGSTGESLSPTGKPVGYTNVQFCIPIKRMSGFNILKYEGKTRKNNGYNAGGTDANNVCIGAGAIVNGVFVVVRDDIHSSVNEWTTYTVDISSLPYIDYIVLYGTDGAPEYKSISLMKA